MNKVSLCSFGLLLLVYTGLCEKGLFFQSDNIPTVNSLAIIPLNVSGSDLQTAISNVTVCLRFKVHHFREKTYLFSYATSDKDNNEMNMGLKLNDAFIAFGAKYYMGAKSSSFVPQVWYHVCFVAEDEEYRVYVDGVLNKAREISRRSILLNASMVLGQETDEVLGGYQEQQSFSGIITDFNLYNRSFSDEEVAALARCEGDVEEGDLISWSSSPKELIGNVTEVDLQQEDYCNSSTQVTVFPERRTFKQAVHWCSNQKAEIALPLNAADNVNLYNASKAFLSICQPPNHAKVYLWIGATDEAENTKFTNLHGKPLTYANFVGSAASKSQSCVGMMIPSNAGGWDDVKCNDLYSFCVPCEEHTPTVYKMRGLCERDKQAILFRIQPYAEQKAAFRGFTKFELNFVHDNRTWFLRDMWTQQVVATYFTYDASYPMGVHTWTLATDYYVCGKPKGTDHLLALSACYDWEYSCDDATCINISQRCDLRVDCPDASDEKACEKLSLPDDYLSTLTPPGVIPGPLNMDLNVSLSGFSEINLRDMKMTVDLELRLSWFDIRLSYLNLKELADVNHIELLKVWRPQVEYVNADFPNVYQTPHVLTVIRESEPEEDDPTLTTHNEVYKGGKNPLQLKWKVNAPFACTMDLQNFPFDTQECQLQFRLTSARMDFLKWNDLGVVYLGEIWLTEYQVGDVTVEHQEQQDYSVAVVSITFYRRFWFYVTSAYLPTVMLMLISHTSLYLKRDNIDLRVMMTLTTLLVLYALYQQIAEGLPRTSYTKAIDVWCFFAITFIFTQVIFQVIIDLPIKKKRSNKGKQVSILLQRFCWQDGRRPESEEYWEEEKQDPDKASGPLKIARICYTTVVFIFFVVYWIVVITSMKY